MIPPAIHEKVAKLYPKTPALLSILALAQGVAAVAKKRSDSVLRDVEKANIMALVESSLKRELISAADLRKAIEDHNRKRAAASARRALPLVLLLIFALSATYAVGYLLKDPGANVVEIKRPLGREFLHAFLNVGIAACVVGACILVVVSVFPKVQPTFDLYPYFRDPLLRCFRSLDPGWVVKGNLKDL